MAARIQSGALSGARNGVIWTPGGAPVAGELHDDDIVTISGSGFGDIGPTVHAYDSFRAGANGESLLGRTPESGTASVFVDNFGRTLYGGQDLTSSLPAPLGDESLCAHIQWRDPDQNTIKNFGVTFPETDRLYVSYWRYAIGDYLEAVAAGSGPNVKQSYTNTHTGAVDVEALVMILGGLDSEWGFYNNNSNAHPTHSTRTRLNTKGWKWGNTANAWQRWSHYWKINSDHTVAYPDSDGIVKMWLDGELGLDVSDYRHKTEDIPGYKGYFLGYMAQQFTGTAESWFKDLYVANSPARIELSTSAAYIDSSPQQRVIQLPVSWANNQLQFKFRRLVLPRGVDLYAHVFSDSELYVGSYQIGRAA